MLFRILYALKEQKVGCSPLRRFKRFFPQYNGLSSHLNFTCTITQNTQHNERHKQKVAMNTINKRIIFYRLGLGFLFVIFILPRARLSELFRGCSVVPGFNTCPPIQTQNSYLLYENRSPYLGKMNAVYIFSFSKFKVGVVDECGKLNIQGKGGSQLSYRPRTYLLRTNSLRLCNLPDLPDGFGL